MTQRRVEAFEPHRIVVAGDANGLMGQVLRALLADESRLPALRTHSGLDLGGSLRGDAHDRGVWVFTSGTSVLTTDVEELERLFDQAYDLRRWQQQARFPIGSTIDNGRYEIIEHLHGTPDRGMYRARDTSSDARMLVTLGSPQRDRTAAQRLAYDVPRISTLRHIGPLATTTEAQYDAMVEDEPWGTPVVGPLEPNAARWVVLEAARIVHTAHERGLTLVGLRPELLYVWGTLPQVTGLAPRCEPFLTGARTPDYGVAAAFDRIYLAPEVLARPSDPAPPAADVFSLTATLAYLLSGEHPFEGGGSLQIVSICAGKRRPWTGSAEDGELIDHGLRLDPAQRLWLSDLIDSLELAIDPSI